MNVVYVLQHVHERDDGVDDVKLIGVFSSHQKAEAAAQRLRGQPGFSEVPDGFHIDEYRLDREHWVEGYVETARA